MVERSFGNPKMMQKPRNSARMNTELAPNACRKPTPRSTRSVEVTRPSRDCEPAASRREGRTAPAAAAPLPSQPVLPYGVAGGSRVRLIEARTGAAAKLLGAESRDIDEKKPVRDGRSRLDGFLSLGFFHCGVSSSITAQDTGTYADKRKGLGIWDWDRGIRAELIPNPQSLIPVDVAA